MIVFHPITNTLSKFNGNSWGSPLIIAEDASEQAIAIDINNKTHIIDNEKFEDGFRLVHYQFIDNEWVGNIIEEDTYGNYGNKLISREHCLYMISAKAYSSYPNSNISIVLRKHEITTNIENNFTPVFNSYNIYPNPSTTSTTISYLLKETKHTLIKIYDLSRQINKHNNRQKASTGQVSTNVERYR